MFWIKEGNVEKSVGAASEDGQPTAKVELQRLSGLHYYLRI